MKKYDNKKAQIEAEHFRKLTEIIPYERLRELAEADAAGKVFIPPCFGGETLYVVNFKLEQIFEHTITSVTVAHWNPIHDYIQTYYERLYNCRSYYKWRLNLIGRRIFFNLADAQAALQTYRERRWAKNDEPRDRS